MYPLLMMTMHRLFQEEWDCESILSTYSCLDNHPTLIQDKSSKTYKPHKSRYLMAEVIYATKFFMLLWNVKIILDDMILLEVGINLVTCIGIIKRTFTHIFNYFFTCSVLHCISMYDRRKRLLSAGQRGHKTQERSWWTIVTTVNWWCSKLLEKVCILVCLFYLQEIRRSINEN